MKVIFTCLSCMSDNKHHRGEVGYEYKATNYECFSDAVKHVVETDHWMEATDHWMEAEINENSDEE